MSLSRFEIPEQDIRILGQQLGEGSFGVVHKATYQGRTVAVKMLKSGSMSAREFLAEAGVMIGLKHMNLVELIGVTTTTEPMYIVTEFMSKGDLRQCLEREKLPHTVKMSMASQIAKGMEHLEVRNIVHRDLAARNCLVTEDYVVKVADFGLARGMNVESYYAASNLMCPMLWTAPEALPNGLLGGRFSSQSDVWSYGVVLWEIWSDGSRPYPGCTYNHAQVMRHLLCNGLRMNAPPTMPSTVQSLMFKCWNLSPNERPSFCSVVNQLNYQVNFSTMGRVPAEQYTALQHIDRRHGQVIVIEDQENNHDLIDCSGLPYPLIQMLADRRHGQVIVIENQENSHDLIECSGLPYPLIQMLAVEGPHTMWPNAIFGSAHLGPMVSYGNSPQIFYNGIPHPQVGLMRRPLCIQIIERSQSFY